MNFHVFDNILPPEQFARVRAEFPPMDDGAWRHCRHRHSDKWAHDTLPTCLKHWLSDGMSEVISKWLGISPIYADPGLKGAGCHASTRGGFLDVHADFLYHPELKKHRAANMIYFVHPYWNPGWGGQLELWSPDLRRCQARLDPLPNRAVLFETSKTSFHGHPSKLRCPRGVWRQSVALYWYTDLQGDEDPKQSTDYRPLPSQWVWRLGRWGKRQCGI